MSIGVYSNGNFPTYRFYLTWHTITYEVFPLGFNETTLTDELENGQIFYRRKFQGKLTFGTNDKVLDVSGVEQNRADDFTLLWLIESTDPCDRLDLTITKTVAGVVSTYWEGYFSSSLCEWDIDRCICSVTPLLSDDYNDILDEGDIEYNLLEAGKITEVTTIYNPGYDPINYTHNRLIIDVIEYLAEKIIPGITVSSTFLSNAINPVTLTTNRYNYLTIAQKSDIKWPTSVNPVTIGMMSFNQIMEKLKCLNLYWDYDGTTLRVEHISFWPQTDGIDIRTQLMTQSTNKYKWLNETMPKYEKFSWMESDNADFVGCLIRYVSSCVNQDPDNNVLEYNFSDITTDLDYIIDCVAAPDSETIISDDGWVIFSNELRGVDLYIYFNVSIFGDFPPYMIPNVDMAWTYLHELFWKHERQLLEGYMNNSFKDFITAKKTKQQECSIILCEDFIPEERITTELGETYFGGEKGKVRSAIIKPSGEISLKLLYGDPDNANPGYTYPKYVYFYEVQSAASPNEASIFYLKSNQPVDADVNFVFQVVIHDNAGHDCTSGNLTLTIVAGDSDATPVNYTWCDTMATPTHPFCLDDILEISLTAGWSFITDVMNGISDTSIC